MILATTILSLWITSVIVMFFIPVVFAYHRYSDYIFVAALVVFLSISIPFTSYKIIKTYGGYDNEESE